MMLLESRNNAAGARNDAAEAREECCRDPDHPGGIPICGGAFRKSSNPVVPSVDHPAFKMTRMGLVHYTGFTH